MSLDRAQVLSAVILTKTDTSDLSLSISLHPSGALLAAS